MILKRMGYKFSILKHEIDGPLDSIFGVIKIKLLVFIFLETILMLTEIFSCFWMQFGIRFLEKFFWNIVGLETCMIPANSIP